MTRDLTRDEDLAIVVAELGAVARAERGTTVSTDDGATVRIDGVIRVRPWIKPLLAAAWEQGFLDAQRSPGHREIALSQRLAGDGRPNPFGVAWRDRTAANLAAQAREWVQQHEQSSGADDGVLLLLQRMAAELDR